MLRQLPATIQIDHIHHNHRGAAIPVDQPQPHSTNLPRDRVVGQHAVIHCGTGTQCSVAARPDRAAHR